MKGNDMKGFTLIELMIVVALIGIVLAVAIPSFNKGYSGAKNREEARHYEAGKIYCIGSFEAVATNSKPHWNRYQKAWTYPMLNSELKEDWYTANVIRECN